jgi:hypothetical protein
MTQLISRRSFAKLSAFIAAPFAAAAADDDKLQSEFLLRLALQTRPPNAVGNRLIVPVAGGTFEGPKLKGTIVEPSGDWIVKRADGANVLDVRLVLQTDDDQKIYMSWHGIAYPMQGGGLHARIAPVFETGAARYAWLNNVLAIGVYQPMPGKVSYRVYEIL